LTAKVILNPYARRWSAGQRIPEVKAALEAAGIAYDLALTQGPGHASELAAQAVRAGFAPIIAAGGDGTISEVVNGLAQASPHEGAPPLGPLGILPLGSANDLLANLGHKITLAQAARIIAAGRIRLLDLGQITHEGRQRLFDNNAAIGLEPCITLIQQQMKRLQGATRYLAAALKGIFTGQRWHMCLEWEGGGYEGPISLVTVGNGPVTGGLFYMAPHASLTDGKLTFVYGYVPNRLQMLALLPSAQKPGKGSYVEHPLMHEIHSPWLRVRSVEATPLHADGEIQTTAAHEIEFRALPGRLSVLV
jgi:diacylglycerol kinase (ATP)